MLNYPQTKAQATKYRYRLWAGEPNGRSYDPRHCAAEVHDGGRSCLFHQCWNRPKYGPDKLYCHIHARRAIK